MSQISESTKFSINKRSICQFILAVAIPLLFLAFLRMAILCKDGETDPDAFYHAKLAELGPKTFLAKKFPTLTLSVWSEAFSDKELGLHLVLRALYKSANLFGIFCSPPFHFYSLALLFIFFATLCILLQYWKISSPFYYTGLTCVIYYTFTLRLLFVRAYLLAMTLLLLTVLLLSIEELRKRPQFRYFALLVIGMLYSYSYSNPHFIIAPVAAFAIAEFIEEGKYRHLFILPIIALVGVILGLCLHPQFPNTWIILKVQCWDVLKMIFGTGTEAQIKGGNEFYVKTWHTLLRAPLLAIMPLFLAGMLLARKKFWFNEEWRKRRVFNAMLILHLCTFIAFLFFFRFIELAMPSAIIFAALVVQESQNAGKRTIFLSSHMAAAYALSAALIMFPAFLSVKGNNHKAYTGLAQWTKEKGLPEGTIIANPRWGAFPMLFYAMPQYRFLNGLDPMFAYAYDQEKTIKIEKLRTRKEIPSPEEVRKLCNSNYLFVSHEEAKLAEELLKRNYKILYQGWDGWLFSLEE